MLSISSPLPLFKSENNSSNSNNSKTKMRGKSISGKVIFALCIASFLAGSLFTKQTRPRGSEYAAHHVMPRHLEKLDAPTHDECEHKRLIEQNPGDDVMAKVIKTHQAVQSLDKTISTLEMELAAARTNSRKVGVGHGAGKGGTNHTLHKVFLVVGINTAFSSKRRRDSVRETWMLKGDQLKRLEKEKGVVMRFVIGHSATRGGVLDRAIDVEEEEHKDFFRLNHVEGYHELSTKTRLFFSTAVEIWDAEFYVKVDDDVHVNMGMLMSTLAKHRFMSRVYVGCMKSGPVLSQKGVKYHEPEYWKFGEEGNKYFRHATGQIYAISKDLATYISINSDILHRYANEDVSLGSWLIGLEVRHVDDHSFCCGTPPDCEFKSQAGNLCVASFDWRCSGICKSVERMRKVQDACGEGDGAVWNVHL